MTRCTLSLVFGRWSVWLLLWCVAFTRPMSAQPAAPAPGVTVEEVNDAAADEYHDVVVGPEKKRRIGAKETVRNVAIFLGRATIDGRVRGNLSLMGGKATINGRVDGNLACTGGRVVLGSNSFVGGNLTVFGRLQKAPGAIVLGKEVVHASFNPEDLLAHPPQEWIGMVPPAAQLFLTEHVALARPLSLQVRWPWVLFLGAVLAHAFALLLFPGAINRVRLSVAQRPVATLFLGFLAAPVFLLLGGLVTGLTVGLGMPFVVLALILALLVGKVAMETQLGGSLIGVLGGGGSAGIRQFGWVSFGLGTVVLALAYLVPFFGFATWGLISLWGLGGVLMAIFARKQAEESPRIPPAGVRNGPSILEAATPADSSTPGAGLSAPPVYQTSLVAAAPLPVPSSNPGFSAPPVMGPVTAPPTGPTGPTPLSASASRREQDLWALPRVGLLPRLVALLIDVLALGILAALRPRFLHQIPMGDSLCLIGYFTALWSWKNASLGGLLTGLRIIRLDGRPLDWQVALVRSLASFLSLFSLGLGELWCAWDNDQQTWQDKLAGTVIVREERLRSLI